MEVLNSRGMLCRIGQWFGCSGLADSDSCRVKFAADEIEFWNELISLAPTGSPQPGRKSQMQLVTLSTKISQLFSGERTRLAC